MPEAIKASISLAYLSLISARRAKDSRFAGLAASLLISRHSSASFRSRSAHSLASRIVYLFKTQKYDRSCTSRQSQYTG